MLCRARRSAGHWGTLVCLGTGVTSPCCTVPQCLVAAGSRISPSLQESSQDLLLCVSCFSKQLFFFLPAPPGGGEGRWEAFVCSVVPGERAWRGCPFPLALERGRDGHGLVRSCLSPACPAPGEWVSCGPAASPCSQTLLLAREGLIRECGSDCRAVPREPLAAVRWQTGLAAVPAARSRGGPVPLDSASASVCHQPGRPWGCPGSVALQHVSGLCKAFAAGLVLAGAVLVKNQCMA